MKYGRSDSGNTRLIILLIVCMAGVGAYYGFKMFKDTDPRQDAVDLEAPSAPVAESLVQEPVEEEQVEPKPTPVLEGPVKWEDGSVYDGELSEGMRNGKGVYTWTSGSKYEGEWIDGKRAGKGVYTWADGTKYDGEWSEDKQSGKGVCTWAGGSVYDGEWVDGQREGKGAYSWSDGTVYEGFWKAGKQVEEADDAAPEEAESEVVHAEPKNMLWGLYGETNVVYLFGSIHLLKEEHYPLSPAIQKAFDESDVIVFEVDPAELLSPQMQQKILALGTLPEGETLQGSVSEDTFKKLTAECENLRIHVGMLNLFKPWLAGFTLVATKANSMGYTVENGVEMRLYKQAKEKGKSIESLESADYQLNLMNKLDENNKNALLLQSLDDIGMLEKNLNEIVKSWQAGDQDALAALLLKSFEKHKEVQEALVDKRNAEWVVKIEEYIKSGKNCMLVGGALHFPGENGVIELLKSRNHYPQQL